ncbi:MAG: PQQ-binding-like beta-propeller repeat protein [Tannerella sp.]|nr:PQQ-binding-like beta-propeller repeat protein [Tannerella sp.]
MNTKLISFITYGVAVLFFGLVVWWHIYTPKEQLAMMLPGADGRPEGSARSADDVMIGEYFMKYDESTPALTGSWPCFRGSDYRNDVRTNEKIDFTADFQVQWQAATGEGYAAPVIYKGLVYLLDYDEELNSDALRCFDLVTGKELWRRWYRVPMKRNHGFSRTVPIVNDKCVITIGPEGHIMCCDPLTGDMKWTMDMKRQYNTDVPGWYTGQCPRIEDDQLILVPAGENVLMIGVNYETGEVLWETPNTPGYTMSHSSVMPMVIQGKKTFVYVAIGGICGVSAEDADKGALLWNVSWNPNVIAPSPVLMQNGNITLTAGYGAGGALMQVKNNGGKWTATLLDQYKASEGLSSEQQTPVLYGQMVITIPPNDGGQVRGKIVAYSPSDIHKPIWESAADERFGYGPYIIIDDHLVVLKDDGELYSYQLEQRSMKLVKKQRIFEGMDAWGPLAYADGYLMLRHSHEIYCLKMK